MSISGPETCGRLLGLGAESNLETHSSWVSSVTIKDYILAWKVLMHGMSETGRREHLVISNENGPAIN